MLQVRKLQFHYPSHIVLTNISFNLQPGEALAITGANGSGKSTLLRCLKGELKPFSGAILGIQELKTAWLRQMSPKEDQTLLEFLLADQSALQNHYQTMLRSPSSKEYVDAFDAYASEGGYEFERQIQSSLVQYGWNESDLERQLKEFSEGQKQILSLMRLTLQPADLYILDEPTNHLDISMCMQLEEMILEGKSNKKMFLIVSHDRVFIDRIADQTLHIQQGKGTLVEGGYSTLMQHLDREYQSRLARSEEIKRRIETLEAEAQRKQTWAGRKEKEKRGAPDKGWVGKRSAKLAKKATIAKRRQEQLIENLRQEKPLLEKKLGLSIKPYSVLKRWVVCAKGISKSFGETKLFKHLDLEIQTSHRIVLIGPNGCGKSTLMRSLISTITPDEGVIQINSALKWVYLPQDIRLFFKKEVLYDHFKGLAEESIIRQFLGAAKIRQEKVFQSVDQLSPGELMRAAIVWCILYQADFLFLDEPTNHLDIESLEVLDRLIEQYPGGFLVISHDRQFIASHGEDIYTLEDGKLQAVTTEASHFDFP